MFLKAGDDLRCVAAYAKLFRKIRDNHLIHKELYVCHSNRSAAYLNLGLFEEALWDARQCQWLADKAFHRDHNPAAGSDTCIHSFLSQLYCGAVLSMKPHLTRERV